MIHLTELARLPGRWAVQPNRSEDRASCRAVGDDADRLCEAGRGDDVVAPVGSCAACLDVEAFAGIELFGHVVGDDADSAKMIEDEVLAGRY